jgi:hypothetical protein
MDTLTVEQTPTGYWTVQRGAVSLVFAMTREAAERELELLERLGRCSTRRAGAREATPAAS